MSTVLKIVFFAILWTRLGLAFQLSEVLPRSSVAPGHFQVPNEPNPRVIATLTQDSPAGAYVAVGTERGFIGAALARNASSLILADADEGVVLFNQINRLLLKISRDRGDYVQLRRRGSRQEWLRRVEALPLSEVDRRILADPQYWEWWKRSLSTYRWEDFHNNDSLFRGANYLKDDLLFLKLKKLADENLIAVTHLNFKDASAVGRWIEEIKRAGVSVAVLDLSNAWFGGDQRYLGPSETLRVVRQMQPSFAVGGQVMLTNETANSEIWGYVMAKADELQHLTTREAGDFFHALERAEGAQATFHRGRWKRVSLPPLSESNCIDRFLRWVRH